MSTRASLRVSEEELESRGEASSASDAAITEPSTNRTARNKSQKRKQQLPKKLDQRRALLNEIERLQATTEFLIPKLAFARLIREIIQNSSIKVTMISKVALEALQEATETYITQVLNHGYIMTLHRDRVTLSVKDFEALRILKLVV